MSRKRYTIAPISLRRANTLVTAWHRHSRPVVGHKFSLGLFDRRTGQLHGAAIVGRPVSRVLAARGYLEITRVVTDGAPFGSAALYRAVVQTGRATRWCTYTLASEAGTSLQAAGWIAVAAVRGRQWTCPSRPRQLVERTPDRVRWELPHNPASSPPYQLPSGLSS